MASCSTKALNGVRTMPAGLARRADGANTVKLRNQSKNSDLATRFKGKKFPYFLTITG
jgi:hypothetical protein